MTDTELIVKRLEDIEIEVYALKCRAVVTETVLMTLWQLWHGVPAGMSPQAATASLLEIVASIQDALEEPLRTDSMPADERARRQRALAETMENLRGLFSVAEWKL